VGELVLANDLGGVGIAAAAAALRAGGSALDAIGEGIALVEADERVRWVGLGGDPNLLGVVECDGAVMDGTGCRAGAVGAVKGILHVHALARAVMEELPHVLLVGEGAERFARERGFERTEMLSAEAAERWRRWLAARAPGATAADLETRPLAPLAWPQTSTEADRRDTTVFLAIDSGARIAAGTSTSGWAFKYPGRLGDSPIVGAGLYAPDRWGVCACTHTGEMTIRAGTALSVVRYLSRGASLEEAVGEGLDDLRALEGGFLGPVVIHALDALGNVHVASTPGAEEHDDYWVWSAERGEIEHLRAVRVGG